MTKQQEAAIARVCAHECLQRELVEALESLHSAIDRYFGPSATGPMWPKYFDPEMYNARAVLARAKEQQ